ncbi:serine/threonine-protein kinase [Nocardioides lijunqiniae]|uniref:serine/threonine-protein kinase n=1 Tax=Nocardioides lijunqiniae TaxID=2760832 RepID=UPI001877AC41|nr:serine/threonine-protein kinase [Nocardioides lijunqiniae]
MTSDQHPRDPDPTQAVDMAGLLGDGGPAAPRPAAHLLSGRYELGAVLGRGGVADVHRATDTLLSREVAVKRLREATPSDADRARFTAEARTLAVLSHPALVTLLDAGDSDDRPYLVLELVEGSTLAGLLARGPLPAPEEAARLLGAVAGALAYAHGAGVVHRDVKPGNVLLGDDGRVKLADFGIARIVGDTVRHTMTGTTVGTVGYLAPEQVSGAEITPAVDVYALGLVLLEAVTGEKAFTGSTAEAAVARLARDPHVPETLSAPLADLVRAMTSRDPGARPSAAVVAERLAVIADGDPTTLTPLVSSPRLRRRPRPAMLVAAAAVALVVALGGAGLLGGGDPSEADRPPAPGTPSQTASPSSGTTPASVRRTPRRPVSGTPTATAGDGRASAPKTAAPKQAGPKVRGPKVSGGKAKGGKAKGGKGKAKGKNKGGKGSGKGKGKR